MNDVDWKQVVGNSLQSRHSNINVARFSFDAPTICFREATVFEPSVVSVVNSLYRWMGRCK